MEFSGTKFVPLDTLGLSQIYLNSSKIASIEEWFQPHCLDNFQPLLVHDFGNGRYTLVDGHTRAYVAYKNGVSVVPVQYDNDEMVAGQTGQMLYRADLDWCERFHLSHIRQLGNRILDNAAYQKFWIGRCDRSYDLLTQTTLEQRIQFQKLAPDLFLYGASEDLTDLFFENGVGELFLYRDNVILPE